MTDDELSSPWAVAARVRTPCKEKAKLIAGPWPHTRCHLPEAARKCTGGILQIER